MTIDFYNKLLYIYIVQNHLIITIKIIKIIILKLKYHMKF